MARLATGSEVDRSKRQAGGKAVVVRAATNGPSDASRSWITETDGHGAAAGDLVRLAGQRHPRKSAPRSSRIMTRRGRPAKLLVPRHAVDDCEMDDWVLAQPAESSLES